MQGNKVKYIKIIILFVIIIALGMIYISDEDHEAVLTKADNNAADVLTETVNNEAAILNESDNNTATDIAEAASVENAEIAEMIMVHVCGAVKNPGVYQVEADSRIIDVINMSGGMLEEAEKDYLNLASVMTDGMKIYVPSRTELEDTDFQRSMMYQSGLVTGSYETADKKLVNINTADKNLLMTLNGIGEARAGDIIKYREQNGAFSRIEDIMLVQGIKEAAFSKIKDYICVK